MKARIAFFVGITFWLLPSVAFADRPWRMKIDPQLANKYQRRVSQARALVRLDAAGATDAELARLGARVLERTGSIVLAELELERLPALAGASTVSRVAAARPLKLRLDSARMKAEVVPLELERPELTGEGVVVGVIDSGIDWSHEAFRNADGSTRIEAIWDMCDPTGPAPAGFEDYGGTLITAAEINAANGGGAPLRHRDAIGHGTFVTSIAAGSGRAGDPSLAGMAPGAAIVAVGIFGDESGCVNPFFDAESDAALTIALRFFHRRAAGRPVSVNMSIGTESPFGDGTSLLEAELTQWVQDAPGRSIAVAAANSGHDYHWGFTLTAEAPSRVLEIDYLPMIAMSLSAEAPVRMRVKVEEEPCAEFPGGPTSEGMSFAEYDGPTPLYRLGYLFSFVSRDAQENWEILQNGEGEPNFLRSEATCDQACGGLASLCGESEEIYVCFENCLFFSRDEELACAAAADSCEGARRCWYRKGQIELALEEGAESARVDVWLLNIGYVRGAGAAHQMSIGDPAGARGILAAGTYVQRDSTIVPGFYGPADGTVGDLAGYSSRGPTIDGRLGIALAAPGELITAAVSSHSWEAADLEQLPGAVPGWASSNGGTSAGAPILAGVAALLLQANPALTSNQLREAMLLGATRDQLTGPKPNSAWGFGKVGALASVHTLQVARADADGDGYTTVADGGLDCDDQNARVHPEAIEPKDGVDNDCDGDVDEGLPVTELPFSSLAGCEAPQPPPVEPPPVEPRPVEPPPVEPPPVEPPMMMMMMMTIDDGGCSCATARDKGEAAVLGLLLLGAWIRIRRTLRSRSGVSRR